MVVAYNRESRQVMVVDSGSMITGLGGVLIHTPGEQSPAMRTFYLDVMVNQCLIVSPPGVHFP